MIWSIVIVYLYMKKYDCFTFYHGESSLNHHLGDCFFFQKLGFLFIVKRCIWANGSGSKPLVFRFQPQIPILQAFLRCAYDLVPVIPGTSGYGTGDKNPTGWLVWQPSYILRIYIGSHIKGTYTYRCWSFFYDTFCCLSIYHPAKKLEEDVLVSPFLTFYVLFGWVSGWASWWKLSHVNSTWINTHMFKPNFPSGKLVFDSIGSMYGWNFLVNQ